MGSGKSTVGALLARELNWSFIDLDNTILDDDSSVDPCWRDACLMAASHIDPEALRCTWFELRNHFEDPALNLVEWQLARNGQIVPSPDQIPKLRQSRIAALLGRS